MSRAHRGSAGPVEAIKNNVAVGAGLGVAAFVVNYVLMYVFAVVVDGVDTGDEGWKAVGQVLFNSQFVGTELSGGGDTLTYNIVTGSSSSDVFDPGATDVASTVPSVVYHAVPIVVLLLAGLLVVRQAQGLRDVVAAAAAGATVVVGYLVLSVAGAFLFETESGMGDAAPELLMAVVLAGVVFPLVAGAIGGAIGNEV